MSDLDNAINSINASAAKAENTATFLDDMSTFDDQSSVTNPNNGQTVASISKQVKDRTDELFTSSESNINQAVADAEQSATDAQDAADSIGRYQGLWPDTGGSANKGDTYQTQVSGTPTGQYFTALQDTTVDPVGDDVNWREVVSSKSIGLQEVISTGSTTPRNLADRFGDVVNVKDFGAVGDGVTDVTAAIQSAIDYCKVENKNLVFTENSTYRITSVIGTNVNDRSDFINDFTIDGAGSSLYLDTNTDSYALVLEGNNIKVLNLTINTSRAINHQADLPSQRTPYQGGLVIGGKGYTDSPRSDGSLSDFKTGHIVRNCTILNTNAPLTLFRSGNASIEGSLIDEFTDTGILVDDPTVNIRISGNTVTRGGDDCIFCRHYSNSPWVFPVEQETGRLTISGNYLSNTFGKNIGIGGLSNVVIDSNICNLNWAGGINVEADSWVNSSNVYNSNITISNNNITLAGRYWSSTAGWNKTAPIGNNNDTGIHTVYNNSRAGSTQVPSNLTIVGNIVSNPYANGIAINDVDTAKVDNNLIIAGEYNHGSGIVRTTSTALWCNGTKAYNGANNTISADFSVAGNEASFPTSLFLTASGQPDQVFQDNSVVGVTTLSIGEVTSGFRLYHNFENVTTGSPVNVLAIPLAGGGDGNTLSIRAKSVAKQSSIDNEAIYEKVAVYSNTGPGAVIRGQQELYAIESDASWDLSFGNSAEFALLRATGASGDATFWNTRVEVDSF